MPTAAFILLAATSPPIHAAFREKHRYFAAIAEGVQHLESNPKIETFTVQPKFEGNALDFGMVKRADYSVIMVADITRTREGLATDP